MLSSELLQFVREHIDSVEQLEMLLLFCQKSDRSWTADEIARELRASPVSISKRMQGFAGKSFIHLVSESPAAYRYAPADPETAKRVVELLEIYKTRRVTIIDTIFSKPIDKIKVFADAFRIREDKE